MWKYAPPIAGLIAGLMLLVICFSTDIEGIQAICAAGMIAINYVNYRWAKRRNNV